MTILRQPEPGALVVATEHFKGTPEPVVNDIVLDLRAEAGVGHHGGAENRKTPREAEQFARERNRAHGPMAQTEAQRSPFGDPRIAFHRAIFIRRDGGDRRLETENWQHLREQTGLKHRVAVEDDDHAVFAQTELGDFLHAEAERETLAFVAASDDEFRRPLGRVGRGQFRAALRMQGADGRVIFVATADANQRGRFDQTLERAEFAENGAENRASDPRLLMVSRGEHGHFRHWTHLGDRAFSVTTEAGKYPVAIHDGSHVLEEEPTPAPEGNATHGEKNFETMRGPGVHAAHDAQQHDRHRDERDGDNQLALPSRPTAALQRIIGQ